MKVFTQRGDYADAVKNELNALNFSEKIGDLTFGAETRSEVGNLYDLEGNYASVMSRIL
jgi:hypothetical protein